MPTPKQPKTREETVKEVIALCQAIYRPMQDVQTTCREQCTLADESFRQVGSLLGDAIAKLNDIFRAVKQKSQTQHDLLASMLDNVSNKSKDNAQQINLRQFASETASILNNLIEMLIGVSKQSKDTVHKIDVIVEQMDAIFKRA